MVREVAIRGLTTHAGHVIPSGFQLISCGITVTCNWLFSFKLAILDHLEQERFLKAAAFFISGRNAFVSREKTLVIG